MSALDNYKSRSGLSDSDSDLDSDAEEERLNAMYGAADEVKVRGRKGDVEREKKGEAGEGADESLAAEVTAKKRKRAKLELGDKGLLSARGLVQVHRSFPTALSKFSGRGKEAVFAKGYVRELHAWANGLFAGLNWEDVLLRVESAGGKEDVKTYLNLMREGARKEGLEKR